MSERPQLKAMFTWRSAICESDLPSSARHVAITLTLYMNERTGTAHPGTARLARDTGLSERHVWRCLQLLIDAGWVNLVQQGGVKGEQRIANVYALSIPDPCLPVMGDTESRVTSETRTGDIHDTNPCPSVIPTLLNSKNNSGAPPAPPKPKEAKKGTRIPDEFIVTPEMRDWHQHEAALVDLRRETQNFVDYWKSATGRTAVKHDWKRTWQVWMRREQAKQERFEGRRTHLGRSPTPSRPSPRP